MPIMRSYSRHELTSKEPVKELVLVTIIQVAIFLGFGIFCLVISS
ncbi:hypothetical protein SAMN05216503_0227 [Polaribacter sp. KT25b]|nr:hypothetical protein SAMN05216503_0227 [Polaribacter sp. KT25b]